MNAQSNSFPRGFSARSPGRRSAAASCGRSARAAVLLLLLAAPAAGAALRVSGTFHTDGRGTTKLMFPQAGGARPGPGRQVADEFLRANHARFGVSPDLSGLELEAVRESLAGTHYRYRQVLDGLPVDGAGLVVSVSRASGGVYQAYNNTYPVTAPPPRAKTLVGAERALDAAWGHLRVHGKLLGAPRARLVYLPVRGGFRLIYKTYLAVEAPFGYWEHQVDAATGEVLSVGDTAVCGRKQPQGVPDFSAYDGAVWSRAQTSQAWEASRLAAASAVTAEIQGAGNGSALVFDGDPRTSLAAEALVDDSPASFFTAAYVTRPLRDISLNAGVYALAGPWVTIKNFEAPNTAPSTTANGVWTAVRGNNAFNDVMTYYHIDQNQRYLQALGYVGDTVIQGGSIEADSDGLSGADNSHYLPAENRLAFGHGGVDDNEDADVILHEYGHAITYDIVPSWGGGDSGAIGEGFGDYWGASYSSTTTNGTSFHPAWAFSWDGHSADTWSGRFLDMTNLTYDASHTYTAHETINSIPNYSDQLWGTPLFQAFLALRELGYPREDVDKIVIESFFGVGNGLTMRDMACATVMAAAELFPSGPHASVFYEHFEQQLLLTAYPLSAPTLVCPAGGECWPTGSVVLVRWDRNSAPDAAAARIEFNSCLSESPPYFSDAVEAGVGGWLATKSGGTDWAITASGSHSPAHSWFAADDTKASEQFLTHAGLVVSNGAVLVFWHAYDLESSYDGAVVEISTNGTDWVDVGINATQNGYNATLSAAYGNPLGGRQAFSGSSGGFIETRIPLTSYQGRTVSLRFREGDDRLAANTGWWVDDISLKVETPWEVVATAASQDSSYAWTLPGVVGTNNAVRVKLVGDGMTDSAWATGQAFTLMGTPVVTAWPDASAIICGQALSASTLAGGAATEPGAFGFAAPDAEPEPGVCLAEVVFTPDDTVLYTAVTGSVALTVAPPPLVAAVAFSPGAGAVFEIPAGAGVQYRLRYADDLLLPGALWLWLTPPADGWVTAPTNGPLVLEDPGATQTPCRFYRLEARVP